jgi:hypothetical protein
MPYSLNVSDQNAAFLDALADVLGRARDIVVDVPERYGLRNGQWTAAPGSTAEVLGEALSESGSAVYGADAKRGCLSGIELLRGESAVSGRVSVSAVAPKNRLLTDRHPVPDLPGVLHFNPWPVYRHLVVSDVQRPKASREGIDTRDVVWAANAYIAGAALLPHQRRCNRDRRCSKQDPRDQRHYDELHVAPSVCALARICHMRVRSHHRG